MSLRRFLSVAVLFAVGVCAAAGPLADAGQEANQKKEQTTPDLPREAEPATAFPQIELLGKTSQPTSLSIFGTTPRPVVKAMLELAEVRPGEIVFDLGSGDGRVVVMAAEKFNARAVGIEFDEVWVAKSRKAVAAKHLEEQIKIVQADILNVNLSPADVVTIYLTPQGLAELRPHLERYLRPGTRVVSHDYEIPGWTPARVASSRAWWLARSRGLYLYKVP